MEERHKSLLRTKRLFLTEHLQPILPGIIDRLLGLDVLNENMKQKIEAETTPVAKVRKLLDILPRRGPHAFNNFTMALLKMGEFEILAQLDPEMAASSLSASGGGDMKQVQPTKETQVQPTKEGKPTVYKPTISREDPNKSQNKVPVVPLPVQVPVSIPGGNQASKKPAPVPQKPQPKIGRQMSRELEKTQQPSGESEEDKELIDWPKHVDLSPGIQVTIQDCTRQDLKKILSDTQVYDMQSSVKGRAVIIKNFIYEEDTKLKQRSNVDCDAYRLENSLKRLRFKVKQYVNQSAEKLMEKLKLEREEDHHDAFILVILSYGGVGTVMCTDGKEVALRDIINVFTSDNCPSLKDKPKLFFIQACGTRYNGNSSPGVSEPDEQKMKDATDAMKSLALGGGDAPEDILQNSQDMMVAIATQPGRFVSDLFGNHIVGFPTRRLILYLTDVCSDQEKYLSLFILGLWTVLYKFSRNYHILELMDKVNTLKKDSGQPVKLCEVRHSLTKKLYFLPGYMGEDYSKAESLPSQPPTLPAPSLG